MSPELIAFALIVEEPGLPPEVAYDIARDGGFDINRLPEVSPLEMLRLAARAYSEEQQ